ncbi:hypothetical protein [Streptomyces gardneri]|uniref:hypothetical protein n=1 Tax=Streptomyces gardneri TaxID=66892 RepID=UPI0035E1C48C
MDNMSEPTVVLAGNADTQLPAGHQDELIRLIDARAETADLHARRAEAESRAFAPLVALIDQDPQAAAAAAELEVLDRAALVSPTGTPTAPAIDVAGVGPSRQPGFNIFGPPYHWMVLKPTEGKWATASTDPNIGQFQVGHGVSGGAKGRRIATAGVGVSVKALKSGYARIAPLLSYDFKWRLSSNYGLSAHTEGWCELLIQDASGIVLPQGHRTVKLWERTSKENVEGGHAGQLSYPDIEVTVALDAGQIFYVTVTGTAVVVDSGLVGHMYSYAEAQMRNWVPWIIAVL